MQALSNKRPGLATTWAADPSHIDMPNIPGITIFEPEIGGKWLQMLKEIAPQAQRPRHGDEATVMPGGRLARSQNRRTMLAGRNFAGYANTFGTEAIDAIVQIARGTVAASQRHPVMRTLRGRWRRRQPRTGDGNEFEAAVEQRVQEELERLYFIPWNVRLAAWIHLLDRAAGKPFRR